MLTRDEQQLLADEAASYPAGVPNYSWGFGPMEISSLNWNAITREQADKYG